MDRFPVTIRLLDPPLHEFLVTEDEDIQALAKRLGRDYEEIKSTIHALAETNPMLGFRGCRLSIVYPEITEMQVRAIITGEGDIIILMALLVFTALSEVFADATSVPLCYCDYYYYYDRRSPGRSGWL